MKSLKPAIEELIQALYHVIAAFGLLLFPRGCAGCGKPDEIVCPQCYRQLTQWQRQAIDTRICKSGVVYSCARYQGVVRHMILSWKDKGDWQCDQVFAESMCSLITHADIGTVFKQLPKSTTILVVPVPSSHASRRKRGRWHTVVLARAVAQQCRAQGWSAQSVALLSMHMTVVKSLTLSRGTSRSTRLAGRLKLTRKAARYRNAYANTPLCVVLVDDIITTGATIRACSTQLQEAGFPVFTALSIAMV